MDTTNAIYMKSQTHKDEPHQRKCLGMVSREKVASTPSEDSDQPAHPRSLLRVFAGHSVGSQGSKTSSQAHVHYCRKCCDPAHIYFTQSFHFSFLSFSFLPFFPASILLNSISER